MNNSSERVLWAVDPFSKEEKLQVAAYKALSKLIVGSTTSIEPVGILSPDQLKVPLDHFRNKSKDYKLESEKRLNALVKSLKNPRLLSPTLLVQEFYSSDAATETLIRYAKQSGASLIAVGTHGRKGLGRFLLGSFAETLILKSDVPVLVVNPTVTPKKKISTILFPTDFSTVSREAFEKLLPVVKTLKARMHLYYKFEYLVPETMATMNFSPLYADFLKEDLKVRRETAEQWAKRAGEVGVKCAITLDEKPGYVVESVLKAAKKSEADLIAMASCSGSLATTLIGSVARKIVRSSNLPVWVIHPQRKAESMQRQSTGSVSKVGRNFLSVLLLSLLISTPAVAKLRKWNQKMQELKSTFSELLPELSDSRPITPTSKKQLEKSTKKLLELAHTINGGPGSKGGSPLPPEADPTIAYIADMFEREVKYAYSSLQSGHTAYAKAVLRTVSGYCIACHSRHDMGPEFPVMDPIATKNLPPMERAQLLAATRQFDGALEEFEKIVGDAAFAKKNEIQWGKAVRHAFTIAVRVKKDPVRALALMDQIALLPQLPGFYSGHIPAWKKSLQEWKEEQGKVFNTEEGLFMEAMRLTKAAKDMQEYPLDHSGDVLYMRSSAILHELLTKYPDGKRKSEALLLAGTAYDLLDDRLVSPLPELYYEGCIRNSPHSEIAEKCYSRFEQNVLFGYTGSGGTFVPEDVLSVMNELRNLAHMKKP